LRKIERENNRFAVPNIIKEMHIVSCGVWAPLYAGPEVIIALNSQDAFDLKTPTIKCYLLTRDKKEK
jgi:hypothetical protein